MVKKNANSKEKGDAVHRYEYGLKEPDFLVDYFRFASRVNALSAIANYKYFKSLSNALDKRVIFVAQHTLCMSSLEDLAKFLNALNRRKEQQEPILSTLADEGSSASHIRGILKRFKCPHEILSWLGIDRTKLIKKMRRLSGMSQRDIEKIIEKSVRNIMSGIEKCRQNKEDRRTIYNTSKHGKAIISIEPKLFDKLNGASEKDGPVFFSKPIKDGDKTKFTVESIHCSEDQFKKITRNVIAISEVIRDLIYFIAHDYTSVVVRNIEGIYERQSYRSMLPELFVK